MTEPAPPTVEKVAALVRLYPVMDSYRIALAVEELYAPVIEGLEDRIRQLEARDALTPGPHEHAFVWSSGYPSAEIPPETRCWCGITYQEAARPTPEGAVTVEPSETAPDFAWLIEFPEPYPTWWDGRGPDTGVRDANDAIRFAREEDARRVGSWMVKRPHVITEHGWADIPRPTPEGPR